jgi:hypothetical protein
MVFYKAWRASGDSSPPNEAPFSIDGQVRLLLPEDRIESDYPIDVYIYADKQEGIVRVDT